MDPFGLDDCTPSPGIDFCVTGTGQSEGNGPGGGELNPLDLAFFFLGGSGSGQAGGSGTIGGESVQKAKELLREAEFWALEALKNPDCAKLSFLRAAS